MLLYQAFQSGKLPGWIPADSDYKTKYVQKIWLPLSQWKEGGEEQTLFQKIVLAYVSAVSVREQFVSDTNVKADMGTNTEEKRKKFIVNIDRKQHKLRQAVADFQKMITLKYPDYKNHIFRVTMELHYNKLNPFRLAWIFYLLGFLFLFPLVLFRKAYFCETGSTDMSLSLFMLSKKKLKIKVFFLYRFSFVCFCFLCAGIWNGFAFFDYGVVLL